MMPDLTHALEKVLRAYDRYYDVDRLPSSPLFDARASFQLHDEQYVLVRSAKISEADSREQVFFAIREELTQSVYEELDTAAWEEGLSCVDPGPNHRNTDIILIILTNHLSEEAGKTIRKRRRYKSYRLGLRGWSDFRVIAYELSSGMMVTNRQGRMLEKTLRNIFPQTGS